MIYSFFLSKNIFMELAFADSLEFIYMDFRPIAFPSIDENQASSAPTTHKHVTFAPYPEIISIPIQKITYPVVISEIQPVSILKKTNYKYSNYNQLKRKLGDAFYLLLTISMLTFFDKFIQHFF